MGFKLKNILQESLFIIPIFIDCQYIVTLYIEVLTTEFEMSIVLSSRCQLN